jgi:DNA-binding NarL/FixJ family response regulator
MTPDKHTRIQVADDHPIVRTGVRLIVESAPDCEFLGETADAVTTFAAVERNPPDVLVLDLWMGGNDGLDLIHRLHTSHPQIRILVYSMADEQVFGPRVLRAGAAGFLLKDRGLDELLQAIRMVASGRRAISPALADELMEAGLRGVRAGEMKPFELGALTDREIQVLRLIGRGQSSAKIAETLKISQKTVGTHRENLKNKLRLADGAELAQRAAAMVKERLF